MYKENLNFKWCVPKDNFFSSSECNSIVNHINEKGVSAFKNRSYTQHLELTDDSLTSKLWSEVQLINNIFYRFNFGGIRQIVGLKYDDDIFKESNIHTDFGKQYKDTDKLDTTHKMTCVIFLNDDYDGGELEISNDLIKPKKGSMVLFPSFAPHKVKQFYNGNRYVLIGVVEGDTFV